MESLPPRAAAPPSGGFPPPEDSQRSPVSPRKGAWDARFRRISPKNGSSAKETGGVGGKWMSKMRLTPATTKPLVPVTERKSQEENKLVITHIKKDEDDKWDITPDGGSAGREGRQFTVANVGNNGRIYLRCVNHSCLTVMRFCFSSRNLEGIGDIPRVHSNFVLFPSFFFFSPPVFPFPSSPMS
jgi:hypothetical protein